MRHQENLTTSYTVNENVIHIDRRIAEEERMPQRENITDPEIVIYRITLYVNGKVIMAFNVKGELGKEVMTDKEVLLKAIEIAKSTETKDFIAEYETTKKDYEKMSPVVVIGRFLNVGKFKKQKEQLEQGSAQYTQLMTTLENLGDLELAVAQIEQREAEIAEIKRLAEIKAREEAKRLEEEAARQREAEELKKREEALKDCSLETLRDESDASLKTIYEAVTGKSAEGVDREAMIIEICKLAGITYVAENPAVAKFKAKLRKTQALQQQRSKKENGSTGPSNN